VLKKSPTHKSYLKIENKYQHQNDYTSLNLIIKSYHFFFFWGWWESCGWTNCCWVRKKCVCLTFQRSHFGKSLDWINRFICHANGSAFDFNALGAPPIHPTIQPPKTPSHPHCASLRVAEVRIYGWLELRINSRPWRLWGSNGALKRGIA